MSIIQINELLNIFLLGLLVITALSITFTRNLLVATILMTIFSLLMSATYLVLGAPDVAITEAAIGAGISTVLFLAVLLLTGEKEKAPAHPTISFIIMSFTAAALAYVTFNMPEFGNIASVTNNHVAPYYLESSPQEIGIPNVVTSILASYRGFDTLGETFVVFTAAISVLLIIGKKKTS